MEVKQIMLATILWTHQVIVWVDSMLPLCYFGNSQPRGWSTGMKLGGKGKDVDSFVDQIRAEDGKGL